MKKKVLRSLLILMGVSVLGGCSQLKIQIPDEGVTVELGEELPVEKAYYVITEDKYYSDIRIDLSDVDVNKAGQYEAKVLYKEMEKATVPITITDTTAPKAAAVDTIRLGNGSSLSAADCISEVEELSDYTVWILKDSIKPSDEELPELNLDTDNLVPAVHLEEDGGFHLYVLLVDDYLNSSICEVSFEVFTPDTESPVITVKDIQTTVGKLPDFMDGVTATDNVDGDLTEQVEVDKSDIDLNRAGTYKAVYSVSDQAGNIGTAECQVIVKEEEKKKPNTSAGNQSTGQSSQQQTGQSNPSGNASQNEAPSQSTGTVSENEPENASEDMVEVAPKDQSSEDTNGSAPPVVETNPPATTVEAVFEDTMAAELLTLINNERAANGKGSVSVKDDLTSIAREKAQNGNSDGSGVITCRGSGATSASIVVSEWKKNWPEGTWMTDAWKYVGVACYNDGGTYTWVAVFGAY